MDIDCERPARGQKYRRKERSSGRQGNSLFDAIVDTREALKQRALTTNAVNLELWSCFGVYRVQLYRAISPLFASTPLLLLHVFSLFVTFCFNVVGHVKFLTEEALTVEVLVRLAVFI